MKLWIFGLTLGIAGCLDSGSSNASATAYSVIAVSPNDFLGGIPCGTGPDAMQSYVATFEDRGPGIDGGFDPAAPKIPLPPAGPVSCFRMTGVGTDGARGQVVLDHYYTAHIDGYDRPNVVLGDAGASENTGDGEAPVFPRWSFDCSLAVRCLQFETQYVRDCTPQDAGTPAE